MAAPVPSDRPVRWGILGAGKIAGTVGADIAASAHSEIAAVAARDADRAAAFAERVGVPVAYGSYAELVADAAVDVVYIATTHGQHYDHALLALRAGKPVLVEKAFTLNAWQAGDLIAEARARELFCMEAMWMRFDVLIRRAQELVAAGRIGDVISVRADLSINQPFDATHRLYDLAVGGGALLDLGVYPVHFAWVFVGRPDVSQATGALSPTGSDLSSALQWGYADGRFAQLGCTVLGTSPFAGLITGTAGWISVTPRLHRPTQLIVHTPDGDEVIDRPRGAGNGYGPQVSEVERCLRAGEVESPTVPLDTTLEIMRVLDAARAEIGVRYDADRETG
jgi:predicted dehydrogenase